MANGDTTVSRLGQANLAGDVDSLFLKVFSGEILTTFEEKNVMKDLHMVRTIGSGKSAQFPVAGIASAKYHTAGQNIADADNPYLSQIEHGEKVINIDDVLIASTFIAQIDELKNHYDVRSIYATELGRALAKRFDIATMKVLAAASRSAANITGGHGGTTLSGQTATTAAGLVTALFGVAETLDNNDAPDEGRFAVLTPNQYYTLLTADNVAINKDTSGGSADAARGVIMEVAGIRLYKSPHLADIAVLEANQDQDDDNANNDVFGASGTGYNGNLSAYASNAGFLAGTKEAIGTVKLLDLAVESEYKIELQGHLFVAKYAMGHGVLRPECAVEVTA
jgi:hypothetical protein